MNKKNSIHIIDGDFVIEHIRVIEKINGLLCKLIEQNSCMFYLNEN